MTEGTSTMAQQMIVRFGTHFAIRLGEWYSGMILTGMAILMFRVPNMFDLNPGYFVGLRTLGDERAWGTAFAIFGGVRLVALYINGRKRITPYIRMAMAFFSCFAWFQLAISLYVSGVPGLGWVFVPGHLCLEMYNVFRSSADAREVFDKSRAERHGNQAFN